MGALGTVVSAVNRVPRWIVFRGETEMQLSYWLAQYIDDRLALHALEQGPEDLYGEKRRLCESCDAALAAIDAIVETVEKHLPDGPFRY